MLFVLRKAKKPWGQPAYTRMDPRTGKLIPVAARGTPPANATYIARLQLPDGKFIQVKPQPEDFEEDGSITRNKVREVMRRMLLGDFGFDKDGKFWQTPGLLVKYEPAVVEKDGKATVVVKRVPKTSFTMLEFRLPEFRHAYDKGLPKEMLEFYDDGTTAAPITPDKAAEPGSIFHIPEPEQSTKVALSAPLKEGDDPMAVVHGILAALLGAKNLSPKKRAKLAQDAKEKGALPASVTASVTPDAKLVRHFPAWAIAKWGSPEEFQRALAREYDEKGRMVGKPITTLITLGLWEPRLALTKAKKLLIEEWQSEIRFFARRASYAAQFTGKYQAARDEDAKEGVDENDYKSSARKYLRQVQRDLEQEGYKLLLEKANEYEADEDPRHRFDKQVGNSIDYQLRKKAKTDAVGDGVDPKMIVDYEYIDEAAREQGPHYVITPQEFYELSHFQPYAMHVIKDILTSLPEAQRQVFKYRFWMPLGDVFEAEDDPEEHAANVGRVGQMNVWEHRPWTGPHSIAEKMAHMPVMTSSGATVRLGDMTQQQQLRQVQSWFERAQEHVAKVTHEKNQHLTYAGQVVQRWLQLSAKLAHVNRRIITERAEVPVATTPVAAPTPTLASTPRQHLHDLPEVKFWHSNAALAKLLQVNPGVVPEYAHANVALPTSVQGHLTRMREGHKVAVEMRGYSNIKSQLAQEQANHAALKRLGEWEVNPRDQTTTWREPSITTPMGPMHTGVTGAVNLLTKLHQAQQARPKPDTAHVALLQHAIAEHLNNVPSDFEDYTNWVQHAVMLAVTEPLKSKTWDEHLASTGKLKQDIHRQQRAQQLRATVAQFEHDHRLAGKSVTVANLLKAMRDYDTALDGLWGALGAAA